MKFVRTKSGLYVPDKSLSESSDHSNDLDVKPIQSLNRRWALRAQDIFIIAIQLITAWILYLNYAHTVVPIQQKDLLAEQVATLQRDADRATGVVNEKLAQLGKLQNEVKKSNAQLLQLQADRDALKAENESSRNRAIEAKAKIDAASRRLKQIAGALELTQWNIFHASVDMLKSKPYFSFAGSHRNYSILKEALDHDNPGRFLIDRYKMDWPYPPAIAEDVASSIREMKSELYPHWMNDQFANVYLEEARAIKCDKPNFDQILSEYETARSSFKMQAAQTVKVQEEKLIEESQNALSSAASKLIRYAISADQHRALLIRASVELETEAAGNLNKQLRDKEEACYRALSGAGDSFLRSKDIDPLTVSDEFIN